MEYRVDPIWRGETCVILGGGPSLLKQSLDPLWNTSPKPRILTINDSWRLAPDNAIHYFADQEWWDRQIARNYIAVNHLGTHYRFHNMIYEGFWVSTAPAFAAHPQVRYLRLTGEQGLETDPTGLRHGSNSGYQAIGLAYHLGVKKIVLLGYDMRVDRDRTHWHDESTIPAQGFEMMLKKSFLPHFDTLARPLADAGVTVINATENSALRVWPFQPLATALGH
jgi:hypothetical protein